MDDTEIFALMSRIHVILRHHENRIADVARMQAQPDYAREIVNLCLHSTHAELVKLGMKLEDALFGPQGRFLRQAAKSVDTLRDHAAPGQAAPGAPASGSSPPAPDGGSPGTPGKKYVRSLR